MNFLELYQILCIIAVALLVIHRSILWYTMPSVIYQDEEGKYRSPRLEKLSTFHKRDWTIMGVSLGLFAVAAFFTDSQPGTVAPYVLVFFLLHLIMSMQENSRLKKSGKEYGMSSLLEIFQVFYDDQHQEHHSHHAKASHTPGDRESDMGEHTTSERAKSSLADHIRDMEAERSQQPARYGVRLTREELAAREHNDDASNNIPQDDTDPSQEEKTESH